MGSGNYFQRKEEKARIEAENLRADIRDAYIFLRDALALVLRVYFYSNVVFGAMLWLYLSYLDKLSMGKERTLIAFAGIVVSVFFIMAIRLSIAAYRFSRKQYLYPARDALGVTKTPGGIDPEAREAKRIRLENWVFFLLYLTNVVYILIWIWVLWAYQLKPTWTPIN